MSGNLEKPWNARKFTPVTVLRQTDMLKSGAEEANRPDVFIGGSQQLHDQVDLLDLRSTGQQRFVSQQLGQDAANCPAE